MITPFIGLSTFIHLSLIIIYKLFHLTQNSQILLIKYRSLKNLLSLIIIVGIFSIILVTAAHVFRTSIKEKHSSVYFIKNQIANFNNLVSEEIYYKSSD